VTREGNTVGTVDYMSPEQARDSRSCDIRSDLYSLGCTAYHMLAGKAPFAQGGLAERILKHLEAPPPDVRRFNPQVSADLWTVLAKLLAKDPDDRHATPNELLRELKRTQAIASEQVFPPQVNSSQRQTEFLAGAPTQVTVPAAPSAPEPAPPAAQGPPKRKRKKRRPAPSSAPLISAEQARAAAAFHERAVQVLAEGGGADYARQLLDNCLKLDPFNTTYRKTLRDMNRHAAGGTLSRWFGSLNVIATKSKMRLARTSSDWRKVLELGEAVLAYNSADIDVQLDMADAALQLNAPELARWCLEQARAQSPESVDIWRALARLYENQKDWKRAVLFWQKVSQKYPTDLEATRKVKDLSAEDMLASGSYGQ
jgi:tetratricopeptide (TPR) repeat protein